MTAKSAERTEALEETRDEERRGEKRRDRSRTRIDIVGEETESNVNDE
jgi:hypothetical protein